MSGPLNQLWLAEVQNHVSIVFKAQARTKLRRFYGLGSSFSGKVVRIDTVRHQEKSIFTESGPAQDGFTMPT